MTDTEAGRPSDFKEEYCQMLIDHMADGLSFRSFAGVLGTTYKTLYNWCDKYPQFLHAKEKATAKCLLYDEKLLKKGAEGTQRGYNIAAHKWKMTNIHGWHDKVEHDTTEETKDLLKLAYKV